MLRFVRLLLSTGPADGSGGAPPPSAETVLNSDTTEADAQELVRLKRESQEKDAQIAERDKRLKERETRVAELEDECRQLKTPPAPPTPVPASVAVKQKSAFLSGGSWTHYG